MGKRGNKEFSRYYHNAQLTHINFLTEEYIFFLSLCVRKTRVFYMQFAQETRCVLTRQTMHKTGKMKIFERMKIAKLSKLMCISAKREAGSKIVVAP